jgi:G3E family GTPase
MAETIKKPDEVTTGAHTEETEPNPATTPKKHDKHHHHHHHDHAYIEPVSTGISVLNPGAVSIGRR